MLKKIMSVTVFFTYSLMAYNIGDTLDTKVSEKLNLKKDTLYVVDFFASWCHACKKELPLVAKVHNDKVVQVIGVNVDDDIAKGKNFVSKLKVPFSVIYDTDKSLITRFNPAGVPALYYIKNSKVLGSQIGAIKDIDKKITNDIKGLQ